MGDAHQRLWVVFGTCVFPENAAFALQQEKNVKALHNVTH